MRALAFLLIPTLAYADQAKPPPNAGMVAPVMSRPAPVNPVPAPPAAPPPEIAALAKTLAGSYTCKGVFFVGNGASTPVTATLSYKLGVAGAWIVESFAETRSGGLQIDDYRTYDGVAKQWHRFSLTSTTGYTAYTSLGDTGGTWNWEGTATGPGGAWQVRDHETPGDRQIKLFGEGLLGGSWQKLYEVTCKR